MEPACRLGMDYGCEPLNNKSNKEKKNKGERGTAAGVSYSMYLGTEVSKRAPMVMSVNQDICTTER